MKGFIPHIIGNTETEAFYYIPGTTDEDYAIGEALVLSSGKVTKDATGAFPAYLCRTKLDDCPAGTLICVTPVRADIEYETEVATGGLTTYAIGTAVDIYSDGMTVTDKGSQSNGSFEIVYAEGGTAGDKVIVRPIM